jgi:hypothetical protein
MRCEYAYTYARSDSKIGEMAALADKKVDDVWEKLNEVWSMKGRKGRGQVDMAAEVNVSTQTSLPMTQVERGSVSTRKVAGHRSKRKIVSPPEDRKDDNMKRAKRGDAS